MAEIPENWDPPVANGMRYGIPGVWDTNRSSLPPPAHAPQDQPEAENSQSPTSTSSPVSFRDFLSQVPPAPVLRVRNPGTSSSDAQSPTSTSSSTDMDRALPWFQAPRSSLDSPFPRPLRPNSFRPPRRVRSTPDRYSFSPDLLSTRTPDDDDSSRNKSSGDVTAVDAEDNAMRNESLDTAVANEDEDPPKREQDDLLGGQGSVDEEARAYI